MLRVAATLEGLRLGSGHYQGHRGETFVPGVSQQHNLVEEGRTPQTEGDEILPHRDFGQNRPDGDRFRKHEFNRVALSEGHSFSLVDQERATILRKKTDGPAPS